MPGCALIKSEKFVVKGNKIEFRDMPASYSVILQVERDQEIKNAIKIIEQAQEDSRMTKLFETIPHAAINHILFRCDNEEKDISQGKRGCYGLMNSGKFAYAGLASLIQILNDDEHPQREELEENIAAGDWLIDFQLERIRLYGQEQKDLKLTEFHTCLEAYVQMGIKKLSPKLKPKYLTILLNTIYNQLKFTIMAKRCVDDFICTSSDDFLQDLAMSVFQFYGRIPSAKF